MLVGITIKNFKLIDHLEDLELGRFHVLVGPNGSGKSTFLEALELVRLCIEQGPKRALELMDAPDFNDLTHHRQGGVIEVKLWLDLPTEQQQIGNDILEYHLALRKDEALGIVVHDEYLLQYSKSWLPSGSRFSFSEKVKPRRLLGKTSKGSDFFTRENSSYVDSFQFGLEKTTISQTPADLQKYPTGNAAKTFLTKGIRFFQLNSRAMRLPCSSSRGTQLDLDGTNLPRVVGRALQNGRHDEVHRWADHLSYALPKLRSIGWRKREADNAEYLVLQYADGEYPSWLVSDGTLRMLGLTLPAFLGSDAGIYMVEEPENGVHPKALDVIMQSLSTIPGSQVLVATHSPLLVQHMGKKTLLCFQADQGRTLVTRGLDHPALQLWEGTPGLGDVFAAGVLG